MLTREVSFPLPIFFTQETFSNNTALPLTPQTGVSGNNNTAYFFLTVALFQWALISPSSLLGVSFRSQSEMPSASPRLRRTMTNLNEIFLCGFMAGLDPTALSRSDMVRIDMCSYWSHGQFSLGCAHLSSMSDMDLKKLHEGAGQCGLPGIRGMFGL